MNKIQYVIIAILLAGCFWLYIEQRNTVEMMKNYDQSVQSTALVNERQRETILSMNKQIKELQDSIYFLLGEVDHLKNNPVVVTKTITKKNEKVIPISRAASEYYNSILSKRYQGK